MGDHQQEPQGMSGSSGLELPPGFRFYPSDEEIITFYLKPKVHQRNFTCDAIGEVNLNRTEPWELHSKVKMGEKLYFFSQKDCKYPIGIRTNRATSAGYWKATGRDKEIYRTTIGVEPPCLIGMMKTLVFYKGRAPTGEKTNWVMHEFRLKGNKLLCPMTSSTSTTMMKSSAFKMDEWVVCHVFLKTTRIKKASTPASYSLAIANYQSSIPMPMPMPLQIPMLSDFTMDPMASYYFTIGASSLSMPLVMAPMVGIGNTGLQMNSTLFGNSMAVAPSMFFYHHIDMGGIGSSGFMAAAESTRMVSRKGTEMCPDQSNGDKLPPTVYAAPDSMATMGVDGIWKF